MPSSKQKPEAESEAESPLERAQSRVFPSYHELFERSADANLIIDGDTFVDCNDATVTMLRYASKEELLQTHPSELSPEFQPDGRVSFEKANEMMAIAFAEGSHRFEWMHQRADGEVFPVEVLLTSVPAGDTILLHTVWREITERKRLEKALRHAQKMEAVGKLAGGIAHDFNNILLTILGYAGLLKTRLIDRPALVWDADEILKAGERAVKLTEQLLAFSRKQDLQPVVLDLTALVTRLTGVIGRLIGEDVEVVVQCAEGPLPIKVDPGQLEQVVLNVVANARDAMARGGVLTIRTARPVGASPVTGSQPGDRCIALTFSDTGSGMSSEVVARAFEPFFTTKERGRGTGLGLASVYGIVKQSGGDVRLQSREGHGTTVEILFPESPEAVQPSDHAPTGPEPTRSRGERVLVVEDDAAAARLILRTLEHEGYRAVVARSGREALQLAERLDWNCDMILSDVIMPGMSGPELVLELRAKMPEVSVLYMSGYTDDVLARHGIAAADAELIRKPFTPEQLVRRVHAFLRQSRSESDAS